ncbi:DNA pilot protein [Dipodfec virus UA23Rod_1340]|uniref:DNA pilot protein n=1 Tax=Dipodfec virus UA23Rod_1340 TaxID=2929330 RepID=A0A976R8Q4_9VIRU|nr:DNA pilot protein [Dipodfec virus UA23Rod_1340]
MGFNTSDAIQLAQVGASVASTAGNIFTNRSNHREAKRAREWQEGMYARQLADSRENWNMQNEYNSPAAQMERLREAGLNPNLVYGNGANNTNSSNAATPSHGAWSPYSAPMGIYSGLGDIVSGMVAAIQAKKTEKEIDSIAAHTALTRQQRVSEIIKQDGYRYANAKTKDEAAVWKKKLQMDLALSHSVIEKQAREIGLLEENTRGSRLRNDVYKEFGAKQALASLDYTNQQTRRSVSDMLLDSYRAQLIQKQASQALENALSTQWDRLNLKPVQRREISNRIASIITQNIGHIQENQIRQILIDNGVDLKGSSIQSQVSRVAWSIEKQFDNYGTGFFTKGLLSNW